MNQLISTFKAESLKLKHSGIATTAFILALFMPAAGIGISIYGLFETAAPPNEAYFLYYQFTKNLIGGFIELFYPIIIIITGSRIALLEHRNNTWQLIETQPVKRAVIYNSKFLKAYQICIYSIIVFYIGLIGSVYVDYLLHPKNELIILDIPWLKILEQMVKIVLCTGFFLALIYSLAVRFSNVFLSIIIGLGVLLTLPILKALALLPKWHPFLLLINSVKVPSDIGNLITYNEYLSILAALFILWFGTFWYSFKNRKWYVTDRFKAITQNFIPLILLLGACYFVFTPSKLTASNQTLITGTVPKTMKVKEIYLLDGILNDTLQTIKVVDNRFYHIIKGPVALKSYRLVWTDQKGTNQQNVVFSTNDVVQIQFEDPSKKQSFKILGTRLAENNLAFRLSNNYNFAQYYVDQSNPSDALYFKDLLKKDYKNDQHTIRTFHTADNFVIRDDYAAIVQNENAYKYALMWDQYKERVLRSTPDFEFKNTTIDDILGIKLTKENILLANAERSDYYQYIMYHFIQDDASEDSEDVKLLRAVSQFSSPELKEQFAKIILNEKSPKAHSIEELNFYSDNYLPMLSHTKYKVYFSKMLSDLKKLTAGNIALSFQAITTTNESKALKDYNGKYVILDFWASWCAPCLEQSVAFEKHAIAYRKRNDVVFISLSIDTQESAWRKKVKLNDRHVVQLYAKNTKELDAFYRLESIPRFVMIDPQGKIINNAFPFPSEGNFTQLLDKVLPEHQK